MKFRSSAGSWGGLAAWNNPEKPPEGRTRMYRSHLGVLAAMLLLGGCSTKEPTALVKEEAAVAEAGDVNASVDTPLADLLHYPQDARAFAASIRAKTVLLPVQERFEQRWFSPWNMASPPESVTAAMWPFASYRSDNAYGENLKPLPQSWFDTMREAAHFEAYGTVNRYAVSLRFASLRNFPTSKPLFKNPAEAGEGFPFDYLQNSAVHANEPLFVSHYSKDGSWAYVIASYATGWLPLHEIAFVPEEHAREWQAAQQLYVVEEGAAVTDGEGRLLFEARLGMLLPLIAGEETRYRVLAVTDGPSHEAWYTDAYVEKDAVSLKPLKFTVWNLPRMLNQLLLSHYGWGGLYGERDCSSTLRDLFTPFGVWLPRNSYQQSRVGRVVSLAGLDDDAKIEKIKDEGVPFETLLYRRGHIVLYLGTYEGKIAIFQNMWGVRTVDEEGPGRRVVGRSVISSLALGAEIQKYDRDNAFITTLESMNIVTQPPIQAAVKP